MVVAARKPIPSTRFWWIRHAPSAAPPGTLVPRDVPPDLGVPVLETLAALRRRLPEPALHFTSDLTRAFMTAAKLSHVPAKRHAGLAEQDFGAWAGQTHQALWDSGDEHYRSFLNDPVAACPPEGESFADVCVRVANAIEEFCVTYEGMDLVIVAHAGTIRAALAVALDLAPDRALRFAIDPLSLTGLDRSHGSWQVRKVNARA
jgi:alpha-ribazole phosphatase